MDFGEKIGQIRSRLQESRWNCNREGKRDWKCRTE